ncbi:MAG: alpha/beta fold hydrolase [Candidatus Omnitrophica bacterium]|nr:alpha/beta fold hydrolase [Candidatus Omnitrophota bacterium]
MKIVLITAAVIVALGAALKIVAMIIEQNSLYRPSRAVSAEPGSVGISYEAVSFTTSDGETLHGWFVPASGVGITVLYCHGNAGSIGDRLHRVRFFHQAGMNLFLFDYRGYGESAGVPSESGLYADAVAAYDVLVSRRDINPRRIIAYGRSLGGPVAAELARRRNVRALILESSFVSVPLRAQRRFPLLPMKLLLSQHYDAASKLRGIRIPKLIVHGKQDEVISFEDGQKLYECAAGPKQFLSFEGGHHDEQFPTSPEYGERLKEFMLFRQKRAGDEQTQ